MLTREYVRLPGLVLRDAAGLVVDSLNYGLSIHG